MKKKRGVCENICWPYMARNRKIWTKRHACCKRRCVRTSDSRPMESTICAFRSLSSGFGQNLSFFFSFFTKGEPKLVVEVGQDSPSGQNNRVLSVVRLGRRLKRISFDECVVCKWWWRTIRPGNTVLAGIWICFFLIRLALDLMWHVCTFIFHFQQFFFSFFFFFCGDAGRGWKCFNRTTGLASCYSHGYLIDAYLF